MGVLRNIEVYVLDKKRRAGTRSLNVELRVRVAILASLIKMKVNALSFSAVPSISMRTDIDRKLLTMLILSEKFRLLDLD